MFVLASTLIKNFAKKHLIPEEYTPLEEIPDNALIKVLGMETFKRGYKSPFYIHILLSFKVGEVNCCLSIKQDEDGEISSYINWNAWFNRATFNFWYLERIFELPEDIVNEYEGEVAIRKSLPILQKLLKE